MRKQEASIRKLSDNVYQSYLKERVAINLEPLYRILKKSGQPRKPALSPRLQLSRSGKD